MKVIDLDDPGNHPPIYHQELEILYGEKHKVEKGA
jgi:hypothetical protein